MPKFSTITPAVMVACSVSLLGGGLAGAFFTWYVHLPSPALVTYTITTTSTGADAITKGLVPNLTLKIGDEDIPVVYTHVVELSTVRGDYVDSADLAITFPAGLRIFGFHASAPSDVHSIGCKQFTKGLVCRVSPLSVGAKYKVNIAADLGKTPTVITASRNTELVSLDAFVLSESSSLKARLLSPRFMVLWTFCIVAVFLNWFVMLRILKRRRYLSFVGRLVDGSGAAISGAAVRLHVEEPAKYSQTYEVTTDGEGDFIVNGGKKVQNLRGVIRVEHKNYSPLEIPFHTPVLFLTLNADAEVSP